VIVGDVNDDPGSPEGDRLVSYGTDGRFTLGIAGGRRIRDGVRGPVPPDGRRGGERAVRPGGAQRLREVRDRGRRRIRPGDEVLVVDDEDALFAVGRAELSGAEAEHFASGVAVKVRNGAGSEGDGGNGTDE